MFFDRTKSVHLKGQGQDPDGLATSVHKPRCSFYLLSVASEEDAPLVYVPYGNSPKWGIGKRNGASAVLTILPIQLDGCISLFAVSEGASRGFKHAVVPVYEKFIREQNYGCQIATYVKESPSDLALALTKHDMSSQSLPQVAGGTWTHQDFLKWLESRRLVELGRKSNLDSRLPAQQARISSQSSGTLSSGLLFTARECLRESDSSANDFASKLLLLHMLKQLSLSTGPTAHLPMLELSDQTSALAKYLEELEQKKRRETNSRGQLIGLLETPLENLPSPSNSDFADDLLSLSLSHDGATRSVESIVAQLSGQGFARTNAMANGAPECHVHFSERDIDQLLVDLSLGQHTRPSKRSCMAEDTCDEVVKDVAREFLQELIESRHDVPLSSEEDPPTDTTTVDTLSYVIESSL